MRIHKDSIAPQDVALAQSILNRLRIGDRVFGAPAEGLKQTLVKLEEKRDEQERNVGVTEFALYDGELAGEISKLKAGIRGEEQLAEYFEIVVKNDEVLEDAVVFASMADMSQQRTEEYIADSDFILVYGEHVLIIDAKNIKTNPEIPIGINDQSVIYNVMSGKEILEVHSSVGVWRRIFSREGVMPRSIEGITCIVNNAGATIWRDQNWKQSDCKPIHVSKLVEFLHTWVSNKDPNFNLSMLTLLAKLQIKPEKENEELAKNMRRFLGV